MSAFLVIMIPPLQSHIIDKRTFVNRAIYTPFYNIGRALTPLVLIMLGANICSII